MDDTRIKALRQCHPELRKELKVSHVLPNLHIYAGGFLTEAESGQIKAISTVGNEEQLAELIELIVKKENNDFDYFCDVLEKEGYPSWSSKLKEAAGLGQSGLTTIEYHMEEGSDTSFQLYQGDQGQVEGETTAVCIPVPDNSVDKILQEFRDDFLNNVNAKSCATELKHQLVIAESIEAKITQAGDARLARGVLYDHLCQDCTFEQVVELSRVLMGVDRGFGKTREVGRRLYTRIQEIHDGVTDWQVSLHGSQPQLPKLKNNASTVMLRRRAVSTGEMSCCCKWKRTIAEHMKTKMELVDADNRSLEDVKDYDKVMHLFYANALKRLIELLQPYLKEVQDAIDTYLSMQQQESIKQTDIKSVESISDLFQRTSVKASWKNTIILAQAVDAIPTAAVERDTAIAILDHYRAHLACYRNATLLKDVPKGKESEYNGEQALPTVELIPVELTSSKSFSKFTLQDCHKIQLHYLSKAIGIPAEMIIHHAHEERSSTTVTFLVPCQYYCIIVQRSTLLESMWILLELDIIELAIPGLGFTFNPSVSCFLAILRGSRTLTADLLGVTEVLPYLMYCLVDPGLKEPLSGQSLSNKRIELYWNSQDDSEPDPRSSVPEAKIPAVQSDDAVRPVEGTSAGAPDETHSRVSELEDKVKDLERKVANLSMDNVALETKLNAGREVEKQKQEEITSLKEQRLQALRAQETATQELSLLKARELELEGKEACAKENVLLKDDNSHLKDEIAILEDERADLIAERDKLQTLTMELRDNERKLQELQEAGLVLKVDMSCLQHRIEILENENAHLIAERSKLQTQTVELKENDQKLQELQEATTQECSQLKADKARLWDKIDMLKADKAYLLAEQVKLPSQTMELKEIEWKPQELQEREKEAMDISSSTLNDAFPGSSSKKVMAQAIGVPMRMQDIFSQVSCTPEKLIAMYREFRQFLGNNVRHSHIAWAELKAAKDQHPLIKMAGLAFGVISTPETASNIEDQWDQLKGQFHPHSPDYIIARAMKDYVLAWAYRPYDLRKAFNMVKAFYDEMENGDPTNFFLAPCYTVTVGRWIYNARAANYNLSFPVIEAVESYADKAVRQCRSLTDEWARVDSFGMRVNALLLLLRVREYYTANSRNTESLERKIDGLLEELHQYKTHPQITIYDRAGFHSVHKMYFEKENVAEYCRCAAEAAKLYRENGRMQRALEEARLSGNEELVRQMSTEAQDVPFD